MARKAASGADFCRSSRLWVRQDFARSLARVAQVHRAIFEGAVHTRTLPSSNRLQRTSTGERSAAFRISVCYGTAVCGGSHQERSPLREPIAEFVRHSG